MLFLLLPACDLRSLTGKLPNYFEAPDEDRLRSGGESSPPRWPSRDDGGEDGTQDLCAGTSALPAADLATNPTFSVAAHDTRVWLDGVDASFVGLQVSGTFSADGTRIGEGRLTGTLDLRPADAQGDPGAWSDILLNFGVTCHACASDGEPFCVPLDIDQIEALEVDRVLVDVAGHECTDCARWTEETVPPVEDQVRPGA